MTYFNKYKLNTSLYQLENHIQKTTITQNKIKIIILFPNKH